MKNTLSLLIALLLGSTALFAQVEDAGYRKFRMGFKASPNLSWMQPKDRHFESEGAVGRFGFGFVADIFFAPNYAIGTGVNIIRNGGRLTYYEQEPIAGDDYILRRSRSYNNQYVEVPFTFKLRTNEIGYMTYWAQFGFGGGINIGARGDDEKNYLRMKDKETGEWPLTDRPTVLDEGADLSQSVRLFRASMIVAAGVEYSLAGTTSLLVGITYNNGLSNSMSRANVLRTERGEPVLDPGTGRPQNVRLNAVANSIELNVGILF